MSKTDIRLMYQKDSGLALETIDTIAYGSLYIAWLESMLETALGDKGALITKITPVPKI